MPSDKPSYEQYQHWYDDQFSELEGDAERWHELVTERGKRALEQSDFWRQLQEKLVEWNETYRAENDGYSLLAINGRPEEIEVKSYESAVNKAYRWNVRNNKNWPAPPDRIPSTASQSTERDTHDPREWFGPNNWLIDFSDIFRVRLIAVYFDGVRYLADKILELAKQTTAMEPEQELKASLEGYHAVHIEVYHRLELDEYGTREIVPVQVGLELQLTTTIQATIGSMLHRVYDDWRLTDRPSGWEWDYKSVPFAVNYLGSTLHYLEGMIVTARNRGRSS